MLKSKVKYGDQNPPGILDFAAKSHGFGSPNTGFELVLTPFFMIVYDLTFFYILRLDKKKGRAQRITQM